MRARPFETGFGIIPAESVLVAPVVLVGYEVQQCDVLERPEAVCHAGRDEHGVARSELLAESAGHLGFARRPHIHQGHLRAPSYERPQIPLAHMEVHTAQHTRA